MAKHATGVTSFVEEVEDELVIRRAVVRAKLIKDLNQLYEAILIIEGYLVYSRKSTWIEQGLV